MSVDQGVSGITAYRREELDVQTIVGEGCNPKVLQEAGVDKSDLIVSVTDRDEVNILACLYAFEDKVSDKCAYALYDGALQLEQAVGALKVAASQCKDDLLKYCANVEVGQGRALACLKKNDN